MRLTISNGIFESELSGIQEFVTKNSEMLLFFKTIKAFLRAYDAVLDLHESILGLIPNADVPILSVDEENLIIYLDLSEVQVTYIHS